MVRNYNLIRSILHEPWLISPTDAETMAPFLLSIFKPEHFVMEPVERSPEASVISIASVQRAGSSSIDKVGVLKIRGPLTKYGTACNYGMEDYGHFLRGFYADPEISAIVIDSDTPGGTVAGTEELGDLIRQAPKPVVAFVSDLAASAGYWLASSCREIYANNTTASLGSIGVMCTYQDLTEYFEKQGIKLHTIYAPQSKDKNEESRAVRAGNFKLTEENLRVLADKFINIVKSNRPAVTADQLTGKVYFAQDVVGTLIDGIDSFENVVARAAALASTSDHQSQKNMSTKKRAALAAAAGVASLESVDGTITLNEEQLDAVEAALGRAAQASVPAGNGEATPPPTIAQTPPPATAGNDTALAQATAAIASLQAEIAALKKLPGAAHATVDKDTDANDDDGDTSAKSFPDAVASAREFAKAYNL